MLETGACSKSGYWFDFCVTQGLLWLVFGMTEEVKDDIFGLLVSCFHFSGGSFS